MPLIEPIIRPPAEADSLLLQVTTGCSANDCTFCGAYLIKPFRVKSQQEIFQDIDDAARTSADSRRVFLLDGDALALNNRQLLPILDKLNVSFPRLTRIASYANGYNITCRTDAELRELHDRNLRLVYVGLESGNQEILSMCNKRSRAVEMIDAVRRAASVGIKSSVMVLLGLGGVRLSSSHVQDTVNALNLMQPRYLSLLSLMLVPGTKLHAQATRQQFVPLNAGQTLAECYDLLQGLNLSGTIFRANHASNYLSLEGRLPHDKPILLSRIRAALDGSIRLRNEAYRGL